MTHLHLQLKKIRAVHRAMGVSIFCISLAISLLGCQKENKPSSYFDNTALRTTPKNLLAKFPPKNQRLIYSLLTATEKSDLWVYHLTDAIKEINANKVQQYYLQSLLPQLNDTFFSLPEEAASATIEAIKQQARSLFTKEQILYLFFTLDASYTDFLAAYNRVDEIGQPDADKPDCGCSTKSDFCSSVLRCEISNCKTTDEGCGFLFLFACNGLCNQ